MGTTFGDRMKREREMRGIKLEEIAESTKIGKRNLEALEQEHFDQLPGGIFNKGFVRAYAKFLGLDEEQAVNDFLTASANYDQPVALQPPPTSLVKAPVIPSDASVQRKNMMWAAAGACGLIAVLGIWFYINPSIWRGAVEREEVLLARHKSNPPASAPAATTSPNGAADSSDAVVAGAGPASGTAQDHSSTAPETKAAVAAIPPEDGFELAIHARQNAWVSIIADGKNVMDLVIPAGSSKSVRAQRRLILKTGNATGLEMAYNGVPVTASKDKVQTLTFTAQGLQQP
jgi:cytoskeleton protein RodZ